MAAQAWHEDLPQFVDVDGFQKSYGSTTVRSNNDVGPQKVRRRTTRPRDMFNVTMTLSRTQEMLLNTFFQTNLNGGAATFYFDNPITNSADEFRFSGEPVITPIGYQTYKVQMSWERIGAYVG